MRNAIYPVSFALFVFLSAFAAVSPVQWKIKENAYSVKFVSTKFSGIFKGLQANISFDEQNPGASKISASIDANTANTGNGVRNRHAGMALASDKYPRIKFESTSIGKKGSSYEAKGKLSIREVTKEIILPFTFVNKGAEGIFTGNFTIVSKEYNITRNGTPEKFQIYLSVPVVK